MAYRQYYISDPVTWAQNVGRFHMQSGSQYAHLINYQIPANGNLFVTNNALWLQLPEVKTWQSAGSYILISAAIDSEINADLWRENPSVTILQHSVYEPTVTFSEMLTPAYSHKKFTQSHLSLLGTIFGTQPTHTVWDLHSIVKQIHPGVRLTRPF